MFETPLYIALGGALGSLGRFWLSEAFAAWLGSGFPWGTVIVNVTGCFVIGFFSTLTGPDGRVLVSSAARQFVMVGICGGYTTFSSFSLQTLNMMQRGAWAQATGHVALSVVACMIAVALGAVCASALNQLKGV